jgi:hypothetical protein
VEAGNRKTGWLSQIVLQEPDPNRPDYPPLSIEARQVCKIIATNLFITDASLQWALWEAMRGGSEGFRKIREKLLSKPVGIMRA